MFCIIFLASLVLIPLANADWTMFRSDPSHDGVGTGNPVLNPVLLWTFNTGGPWIDSSSPAVVNGVVYIGAMKVTGSTCGYIYALNAANGAQLWNYTTGNYIFSSPAVVDGIVYIGSDDDNVNALNATSGAQIWKYTTGFQVNSSPTVVGGIVYIGSADGTVYALNASSGAKLAQLANTPQRANSVSVTVNVTYLLLPEAGLTLSAQDTYSNQTFLPKIASQANVTINGVTAQETSVPGEYSATVSTAFPTAYVLVAAAQSGWITTYTAFGFTQKANEALWGYGVIGLILAAVVASIFLVLRRKPAKTCYLRQKRKIPVDRRPLADANFNFQPLLGRRRGGGYYTRVQLGDSGGGGFRRLRLRRLRRRNVAEKEE